MEFLNPWAFALTPVVLAILLMGTWLRRPPAFSFTTWSLLSVNRATPRTLLRRWTILLRIAAALLVITALARPQLVIRDSTVKTEGIDIVLAIDSSTSMLAEDFKLKGNRANRLEAVKDVVSEFIKGRNSDRISLVAFAGRAYTVAPLTFDYGWLVDNLKRIETGLIEDGTAIGSAIAASLNRLKDSKARQKVIILLTDGRNNTGRIAPETAAEAAQALGIRIYAIGAGTKGLAPYPVQNVFGRIRYKNVKIEIDEDTLRNIASATGGKYFRATDSNKLRDIYKEIDTLEKTTIERKMFVEYHERFHLFLIPALCLLSLEALLRNTIIREIP